ncbi:MAG: ROK family protein [Lentimicrobium sp.]|nr:ROK family protein [Lentimicrobium sp.]
MIKPAIGSDIGGTHITCRLFDLHTNSFEGSRTVRKAVDCHAPANEILDKWASSIALAAGEIPLSSLAGIGMAMPGPFDYENGVAWFKNVGKFEQLFGVNVREELITRLSLPHDFRIRFQNDAACFAIGESFTGQVSVHHRLLAITLGTGFGTTFIEDHSPVAGKYGIPDDGFLYHIAAGSSIADDQFSTRWFLKEYLRLTGNTITGVKELAHQAEHDTLAAGIFMDFGKALGEFLSPWLRGFDAGGLVIGGNISAAFPLFGEQMQQAFTEHGAKTQIYISQHQEDSALSGSACLCL